MKSSERQAALNSINELMESTEILVDALETSQASIAGDVLRERGRALRTVEGHLARHGIRPEWAEPLKKIRDLGERARLPLSARRENLKQKLSEVRQSRRVQETLQPPPQKGQGDLDVSA